jgi:hypothetical protein
MTTPYNFVLGSTYTFNTLAPAILGSNFENVILKAIMDYDTAMNFSNVALTNKTIYPLLPTGTPSDPTQYQYYKFLTSIGTSIILASPWIDNTSVTLSSGIIIHVAVNNVGIPDIARIQNALSFMGYTNFQITSTNI